MSNYSNNDLYVGTELIDQACIIARNKRLNNLSVNTIRSVAKQLMYDCEYFDGEPTSATWFAAKIVERCLKCYCIDLDDAKVCNVCKGEYNGR